MSTVTEDIEAFLTLHSRFKAGRLASDDMPRYQELRTKVQKALLEPENDEPLSNVIPMKRPALA